MPRISNLNPVATAGAKLVANSSTNVAGLVPTSEFLLAADFDTEIGDAVQTALNAKTTGPASSTDSNPAVYNGTGGKTLKEISYSTFKTNLALVKADVGLGNVDNTSDANKPVSTATQTALDTKLPIARAIVTYADRTAAAAATISTDVNEVTCLAYNASASATRGRARYRLAADMSEYNTYPSTLRFTDAGGRRFVCAENPTTPEMAGATGDGTTDDTQAFIDAQTITRSIKGVPGTTYVIGDFEPLTNADIDLYGCIIKRKSGADHAIKITSYHATVRGGDFLGSADWKSTTVSGAHTAGDTTVDLASATGFEAGMWVFYPSAFRTGIEANRIVSVAGNTVTLQRGIRGNLTSGVKFLGDHALVKTYGPSLVQGAIKDIWIRNCLVGMETGDNTVAGRNSFTTQGNIRVSDVLGAGFVISGNTAGETLSIFNTDGGYTQTSSFTGNGATTTYAYPYSLSPIVHRWGSAPSVRVYVNGTQLTTSQYTADPATAQVTLTVAPANGATVQVINYEFTAFGVYGDTAVVSGSPSSIECIAEGIAISCRVGMYFEDCELGFLDPSVRTDGCSYAGIMLVNCDHIHISGMYLYAPFPIIIDGASSNCSIGAVATSLTPDAEELSATASKKEITVETGATNIQVDWFAWHSQSGYTHNVVATSIPAAPLRAHPNGFAIGGTVSGRMMLYGTSGDGYLHVSSDAKQMYFGGSGYNYLATNASGATLQIGAVGTNGAMEFRTGATIALYMNSNARLGVNRATANYRLDVNGSFGFAPGASVTPSTNGDVVFELTNNTTLTVKAKGSDGTVRSATITLA